MSNALAFDTYAYVRKLRNAGVTEEQAAIQAEALVSLIEERLATKKDLADVEASLKRDIRELDTKLEVRIKELELSTKAEIARLQADIAPMKWMMAVIVAGIVALVLKAFFPVV